MAKNWVFCIEVAEKSQFTILWSGNQPSPSLFVRERKEFILTLVRLLKWRNYLRGAPVSLPPLLCHADAWSLNGWSSSHESDSSPFLGAVAVQVPSKVGFRGFCEYVCTVTIGKRRNVSRGSHRNLGRKLLKDPVRMRLIHSSLAPGLHFHRCWRVQVKEQACVVETWRSKIKRQYSPFTLHWPTLLWISQGRWHYLMWWRL